MSIYSYADGKKYLHYENWVNHRNWLMSQFPPSRKFRIDVELINPTDFLVDVNVARNPHSFHRNIGIITGAARDCFYFCDEWTVASEVHEVLYRDGSPSRRFLIESGEVGNRLERVILYCSSQSVWNEPWGRNKSNHFMFFRNQFWYLSFFEVLGQSWKFYCNYPLRDVYNQDMRYHSEPRDDCHTAEDFPPPSFTHEPDEHAHYVFMEHILEDPSEFHRYLVYSDWLREHGGDWFADYVVKAIAVGGFAFNDVPSEKLRAMYHSRPKNFRTNVFMITNMLQQARSYDEYANNCLRDGMAEFNRRFRVR